MGSLCCVAARPHGTSSTNREWPLTPNDPFDPFWRTNTSFSLTPNDPFYRYRSHGSQSSDDGIAVNNYSSSDSSRSSSFNTSRSWERSNNEDFLVEGAVSDFGNLEGGFENWQDGGADFEEAFAASASRAPIFSSFLEETSFQETSYDSTSSLSDSSTEYSPISKPSQFAPRSLPSNLSRTLTLDSPSNLNPKCSICNKLLSRRSPWGPPRIVRNSDMPAVGILSCSHAYHSECLDRINNKSVNDPLCPVCDKRGTFSICRMKNGSPKLRSLSGEGTSRVWSFGEDRLGANLGVFRDKCVERGKGSFERDLREFERVV